MDGRVYKIDGPTFKVKEWVNGGLAGSDFRVEGRADHVVTRTGNWFDVVGSNMAAYTSFKRMMKYAACDNEDNRVVLEALKSDPSHGEFYYGKIDGLGYILHEMEFEHGGWEEDDGIG